MPKATINLTRYGAKTQLCCVLPDFLPFSLDTLIFSFFNNNFRFFFVFLLFLFFSIRKGLDLPQVVNHFFYFPFSHRCFAVSANLLFFNTMIFYLKSLRLFWLFRMANDRKCKHLQLQFVKWNTITKKRKTNIIYGFVSWNFHGSLCIRVNCGCTCAWFLITNYSFFLPQTFASKSFFI